MLKDLIMILENNHSFFFHSRVIVYIVLCCIVVCSFRDILHFHFHFLSLINHLMAEINSHYPSQDIHP